MEADLQRFYNVDYRDRWRGDLSLRRLSVLVRHLPEESAVHAITRDGKPHWSLEAHLLDDLRLVFSGARAKPHPLRPRPEKHQTPEREHKLADARRRARARRAAMKEE